MKCSNQTDGQICENPPVLLWDGKPLCDLHADRLRYSYITDIHNVYLQDLADIQEDFQKARETGVNDE